VFPSGPTKLMAYDADTGAALWNTPSAGRGQIAEDPRSDTLIVADTFGGSSVLQRFDRATGARTGTYDTELGSPCIAETSPDGRFLAGGACDRSAVALWSLDGAGAAFGHVTDLDRRVFFHPVIPDERYVVLDGAEDERPPDELELATGELTPIEIPPG
jgi:outer membrane protein assembly factor BamB